MMWTAAMYLAIASAVAVALKARSRYQSRLALGPLSCHFHRHLPLFWRPPSERQRIQRTLKLLVYEAMAN
jgi:hypothetical protein